MIHLAMEVTYKKATQEDIPTLLTIEKSMADSNLYSAMLEESEWEEAINAGPVYLIERDGRVVGDITYEIKSLNHVYISGIIILPEFQGQGIAKQAMRYLLHEIGDIERIDLVTHPDNVKAIELYKSLGFKIESRIENYFEDGEPRIMMVLLKS